VVYATDNFSKKTCLRLELAIWVGWIKAYNFRRIINLIGIKAIRRYFQRGLLLFSLYMKHLKRKKSRFELFLFSTQIIFAFTK
jgi:hypothetical protein